MSVKFSHVFPVGQLGSVEIAEGDGVLSIAAILKDTVGGGKTTAVIANSTKIEVPVADFADAFISFIESKVKGSALAVAALETIRTQIRAQLGKQEVAAAEATPTHMTDVVV